MVFSVIPKYSHTVVVPNHSFTHRISVASDMTVNNITPDHDRPPNFIKTPQVICLTGSLKLSRFVFASLNWSTSRSLSGLSQPLVQ
jgi:hypothetical protein